MRGTAVPSLPMPACLPRARRVSQAGSQALSSRGSKNLRTGSHADTECWHGLFDIQTKSFHRRFVHWISWTHRYDTPTWATRCANVMWLDLALQQRSSACPANGRILLVILQNSFRWPQKGPAAILLFTNRWY